MAGLAAPLRGASWPSWRPVVSYPGNSVAGSTIVQGAWSSDGTVIQHHHVSGGGSDDALLLSERQLHGGCWRAHVEVMFPVGRTNGGSPLWEFAGLGWPGSYACLALDSDGLGDLELSVFDGVAVTPLSATYNYNLGAGWSEGDWIALDLRLIGNELTVWVDTEMVHAGTALANTANNSAYWIALVSYLLAGLSYSDGAKYRNISIGEPEWGFPS